MRLIAFRIQSFRSFIDTGYTQISTDNITALIGQNESGKTSILEALRSFYSGNISPEVLRSEGIFPSISCRFQFSTDESIEKIIDFETLPDEISKALTGKNTFSLTRQWIDEKNSKLFLDEDELNTFFAAKEKKQKQYEQIIISNVNRTIEENEKLELQKKACENKRSLNKKKLHEIKNNQLKFSLKGQKSSDSDNDLIVAINKKIETFDKEINQIKEQLLSINELYQYSVKYKNAINQYEQLNASKTNELKEFSKYNALLKTTGNFLQRRTLKRNALHHRNKLKESKQNLQKLEKNIAYQKRLIYKLFDGIILHDAENQIQLEDLNTKHELDRGTLAHQLFNYIPSFSFFEDFGNLLPDRIELESVLNGNTSVEGYKAVSNILSLIGIDKSFFSKENERVLKQKIESLNGELTLDFQEFWRQSIGKGNKIQIGFDLDYYSENTNLKSGKPYLEFWIKDKNERLYPKQRSRGVRWFLSFYLELKATSQQGKPKILLIDEPGVSLHARAQEDVLKVFEDLKDKVQIIYSTHSPQLIDSNKLFRVLAIQRQSDEEKNSSIIFDVTQMENASADTLAPIYSTLGNYNQSIALHNNNLVVEDIGSYYLLSGILKLFDHELDLHIIPATGLENLPVFANILMGWNTDFSVLLPDTQAAYQVRKLLNDTVFLNLNEKESKVTVLESMQSIFDLFSTIDFKKHVLNKREGITETNTEYLINNNYSVSQLASAFAVKVNEGLIKTEDFDFETTSRIKSFLKNLEDQFNSI
jgi:predicted ATP-dependent endonuclease of OLD family